MAALPKAGTHACGQNEMDTILESDFVKISWKRSVDRRDIDPLSPHYQYMSNGIVQGGWLFKTSRSHINQNEVTTMLARLVSETWQEDSTKPVFVDRDGDIFAQVLNYLRYGSIILPNTIEKTMNLEGLWHRS